MLIKVNGRLRFFEHVEGLRRVSKSRWIATRHGVEYQIEGGKHAGGTRREWFVDGPDWNKSIDCTSLMDAMRLLEPAGYRGCRQSKLVFLAQRQRRKFPDDDPHGPECYCHGDSHDDGGEPLTERTASECGCEYAYVFDEAAKTMRILSSYRQSGAKMIGMFGFGDPNAVWKEIAFIDLEGQKPDWDKIGESI